MNQQNDMYRRFGIGYLGLMLWVCLVLGSTRPLAGPIVLGAVLLLTSPLLYWYVQLHSGFEHRKRSVVFDWRHQSWSLYGDALLLMPAAVTAKFAWYDDQVHLPSWAGRGLWFVAAALGGWIVAIVFQMCDRKRYAPESLVGPAKVYHDYVVIPVYISVLIAVAVPVLIAWDGYQIAILSLIGGWVVLAAIDGLRYGMTGKYRLDAAVQHPPWDEYSFRLLNV